MKEKLHVIYLHKYCGRKDFKRNLKMNIIFVSFLEIYFSNLVMKIFLKSGKFN